LWASQFGRLAGVKVGVAKFLPSMKIVGATGLGRFVGVRGGVAYSRNKLACIKIVGATGLGG